ncbi:MAG: ATP-binding protein [Gemmatimonadaceae bacterium]
MPRTVNESPDALLRAAMDHVGPGVIIAGADGRLVFVNEPAARMHGLRQLGVYPAGYSDAYRLFTTDGRPYPSTDLPLARAVRDGETIENAEWMIRRPDGTEVVAIGSARPLIHESGQRIGAVLTIHSGRTPAAIEADRRDRDLLARRLHSAFEQSPVSTVVYDGSGRPTAVNPAFEKLWGASIDDVPAGYTVMTDPQLVAAGVIPLVRRAFDGEATSLPPVRYEMSQSAGRGKILWTQAHLYPVRGADGRIEQVVLTHEDVTARHDAEEGLSHALARTEQLQTLTAALSQASTPDEVGAAIVQHATAVLRATSIIIARIADNGNSLELLNVGVVPDSVIQPWRSFPITAPVPLADVARGGQAKFIENRSQWIEQYPHLVEDLDSTGHCATIVLPLFAGGRPIGVMGAAFDHPRDFDEGMRTFAQTVANQCAQALDRSRLFESERVARREAESANRAKSDFLAIMSHELRTPLNAIGGYAELLEMGVRGPLGEEQRRDLGRIQASQRHLLGLINEVLNYAKLESGNVIYDIADIPIAVALLNAQTLVAPQARRKGLTLVVTDCSPDIRARADAEKVQQILVNLLSNAVKFTDRGGIEMFCTADPERVFITVRDTGIGIAREQLGRIFEPFVQVRADLTRTAEGTGLGLAISRDLARAMNGDLRAESETGRGSEFTVVLPRATMTS